MAYSEKLANKIRHALAHLPDVEEKKMFGGMAFMVDGKMCLTAGANRMMCRIDPGIHEDVIRTKNCCTVNMNGRVYRGYVYVNEGDLKTKANLNYWVTLALDFNKKARVSGKRQRQGRSR